MDIAASNMGGDLGGTVPPKFEMGDGPCFRPSNISRNSVIGCVSKCELTKKGVMDEFFPLKWRFFVKKKVIYVMYRISDSTDKNTVDL